MKRLVAEGLGKQVGTHVSSETGGAAGSTSQEGLLPKFQDPCTSSLTSLGLNNIGNSIAFHKSSSKDAVNKPAARGCFDLCPPLSGLRPAWNVLRRRSRRHGTVMDISDHAPSSQMSIAVPCDHSQGILFARHASMRGLNLKETRTLCPPTVTSVARREMWL